MQSTDQKLREACNYIDALGGDSRSYRQALALPTADHLPNAGKMINGLTQSETDASASVYGLTAAPVVERAKFEAWKKTMQNGFDAWDAWQAALSAGDAVDAQRLDFIEKSARCDPKMDGQHVWWPTSLNKALKGPTLRDAIDAATRKDQQ